MNIDEPSEPPAATAPDAPRIGDANATVTAADARRDKKKKKTRSAWISFAGRVVAQVVGAAATIVLGVYFVNRNGSSEAPKKDVRPVAAAPAANRARSEASVAVLSLQNYSGDPAQEYIADGMTEMLIAKLAEFKNVRVISRTSSNLYKGQQKTLPEIASELGVAWVVEGSVAKAGARIRVTAQLINADRDEHVWTHSYESSAGDVLRMQSDIAGAIAEQVTGVVTTAVNQSLQSSSAAVDPQAYDLYLRGRFAWSQRTPDSAQQAVRFFSAAIEKDANFALAYAGLADAYQFIAPGGTAEGNAKARVAARRALEIDDRLAEAHTAYGGILHHMDGDRVAAEREFRRAIELNPGDATAHQWYAILLGELERDEEALAQARLAVSLDPLSGVMQQSLGLVHFSAGRYDEALAAYRKAIELTPQLTRPRDFIARILLAKGDVNGAITYLKGQPDADAAEHQVTLAAALARAGDRAAGERIIQTLKSRQPAPDAALARWYALEGDRGRAIEMLNRVVTKVDSFNQTVVDPIFKTFKEEPTFLALKAQASNASTAK